MITQSTSFALEILWREEPGGLQSMESQKSQTQLVTEHAYKKENQLMTKPDQSSPQFW